MYDFVLTINIWPNKRFCYSIDKLKEDSAKLKQAMKLYVKFVSNTVDTFKDNTNLPRPDMKQRARRFLRQIRSVWQLLR